MARILAAELWHATMKKNLLRMSAAGSFLGMLTAYESGGSTPGSGGVDDDEDDIVPLFRYVSVLLIWAPLSGMDADDSIAWMPSVAAAALALALTGPCAGGAAVCAPSPPPPPAASGSVSCESSSRSSSCGAPPRLPAPSNLPQP